MRCISLRSVPLNALVGSAGDSIALHSSGHLLQKSTWMPAADAAYGCGDIVGVCVRIHESHIDGKWLVSPHFFVNGKLVRSSKGGTVEMNVPWGAELFPTLSLYTPNVRVFGHFAAGDVRYGERHHLACVAGSETVFSLDGSILH